MKARRRCASRRRPPARAALALLAVAALGTASPAASAMPAAPCARHAGEAAARARIGADIVLRVMHVESRGRPTALSPKGAMGCMQIMPATWRYLTARHALGADPWDARMNMIGGALYLAELIARFGLPGAYSAYNAGPARYARHVASGAPLPRETILYTAMLTGRAPPPAARGADAARPPARWQEASLFLAAAPAASRADDAAPVDPAVAAPLPSPRDRAAAHPAPTQAADRSAPHALFPLARRDAATERGASSSSE